MLVRGKSRYDRDVRERLNCMRHLVEAGIPRRHVARILGYSSATAVRVTCQKLGFKGRVMRDAYHQIWGPRPCVSCLKMLPKGHGFPRCEACDRAHHRYGDCACGYAIRMSQPTCKRCGKERPEALGRKGCARRAALVAAILADPLRPVREFGERFGYLPHSVHTAIRQEGAYSEWRRAKRRARNATRLEARRERQVARAALRTPRTPKGPRPCGCGERGRHRATCTLSQKSCAAENNPPALTPPEA